MAEFAKYAFNKSHAAAYAVIAYQTAFLKYYYKEEFMAATLNSFLGNLGSIPYYIEECKNLGIEILKPDINKSFTKFTVDNGSFIRFGMGSVKNVGVAAVDSIVAEREQNGEYKNFIDFCERIQNEQVNKKCIESLIKAGAFDDLDQNRSTLMSSFETILDTISNSNKRNIEGQVDIFNMGDLGSESISTQLEDMKYTYTILPEFSTKEILQQEKEMLGLYISGHPLDNIKEQLNISTSINSLEIINIKNDLENNIENKHKDGENVVYGGVITSIKKKYTKTNKIMAFVSIEDLYGIVELIVFENAYIKAQNILIEDNIVLVDGRLSIREDDDTKIVANEIKLLENKTRKILKIQTPPNMKREQIINIIKFFSGDKNNILVELDGQNVGNMYLTEQILEELKTKIGNVELV